MKLLIINNLKSGYRDGGIYDFIRSFAADGDEVVLRSIDNLDNIDELLKDASQFDAVVASGGDGTIAAISYRLANTGIPILPFPAGTANLLCLNLQAPAETHALAKLAREGKTMDFDIGEIVYGDTHHGFNIMAGAGYDAAIMKDAVSMKQLLGPLAYFTAAFSNITPTKAHFSVDIDGKHYERYGLGILLINFSKIQFDVPVAHGSDPCDGQLEVAIMKSKDALGLIPAALAAFMDRGGGKPDRSDALEILAGKDISFSADPPLCIQYDGEAIQETTPVRARVLHKAARYIVSDDYIKQIQGQ